MVFAQKDNYKSIYSIEIQPELYTAAKRRFVNYENINILFGDSGKMMPELV
jgi:protein-L-isoaspartate O-methyltransferase